MANDIDAVVVHEVLDGVAHIRFNRPRQLNALNLELAKSFDATLDDVLSDPSVRVIVLSGKGRAFMAGGDLALFRQAADKAGAAKALIEVIHGSLKRLAATPRLVIASLHGAVAGAGMSLALNADLVIAADDVIFDLSYVKIGASPDCGATWALPRLVGTRRALEISLLSPSIPAEEALRLNLVNRVVPASTLEAETADLAARLASGPTVAYGWIKRLVRGTFDQTFIEQLDAEREGFAACAATQDFSIALDAFFARRSPEFKGL